MFSWFDRCESNYCESELRVVGVLDLWLIAPNAIDLDTLMSYLISMLRVFFDLRRGDVLFSSYILRCKAIVTALSKYFLTESDLSMVVGPLRNAFWNSLVIVSFFKITRSACNFWFRSFSFCLYRSMMTVFVRTWAVKGTTEP